MLRPLTTFMKILLMPMLITCTMTCAAQIPENTLSLGGSGSFRMTVGESYRGQLNPQFGWFPVKNFLVGASLPLSVYMFESQSQKRTDFEVEPGLFTRYYVGLGEKVYLFPKLNLRYSWGQNNLSGSTEESRTGSAFFGILGLGLSFWLNESVAFEPVLSYRFLYITKHGSSVFNPELPTLQLGFQFYLNAKER